MLAAGYVQGKASPCIFHNKSSGTTIMVHGDDFVFSGYDDDMDWVAKELSKNILLNIMGKLGDNITGGDVQEVKCLNRIIRWSAAGFAMEADPRHAELLAAMLGPRAAPLSTPGIREAGRVRGRVHDGGVGAGLAPAGDGARGG